MNAYFTLPGISSSGPNHWQTLWEKESSELVRVEQVDWETPDVNDWIRVLDGRILSDSRPAILVAHSLGSLLVLHWAFRNPDHQSRIAGAFLVAPPDPNNPTFPPNTTGFSPLPNGRPSFPIRMVVSSNDPYASILFSRSLADEIGAELKLVGERGHINAESGIGLWEEGFLLFSDFLQETGNQVPPFRFNQKA